MLQNFSDLHGHTLTKCYTDTDNLHHMGDAIFFEIENGEVYVLYHNQDCCEHVYIESIDGELERLVGGTVLLAEEASNEGPDEDSTWTFYKLSTNLDSVNIRWYGSSNGYYSEGVDWTLWFDPKNI